ncbi:MAG: leucine-rich repeat domain-containing protein [Mycoplasmoidaceae bacterium]|nr:leucine-rich repeat domain-containing protein [Mycoplasmoidaceae bacterium]
MPGVKYVGNNAFYNCTHVSLFTTYSQPQLVHIGENSFYNCSKLKLNIQQPAIAVDDCAFAKSGVDQIIFGSSIESIGSNVFDECSGLETIEILNEEPPLLSGPLFSTSTSLKQIKVPSKSLEKYKNTGI